MKTGVDYASGNITVLELLERYIALKQGVRYNTRVGYDFVMNLVCEEPFRPRIIRNIRASDAVSYTHLEYCYRQDSATLRPLKTKGTHIHIVLRNSGRYSSVI